MRQFVFLAFFVSSSYCKTALVLSGGGAKGSVSLGYLEGLCNSKYANTWDMVVGTSIGSLAAGLLAMFPKERQCTDGLAAVRKFWLETTDPSDVFRSTSIFKFNKCLSAVNALSAWSSWTETGGMCDASPGTNRYLKVVNKEGLRRSGMRLYVTASALDNTLESVWFTNETPNIIEGILASGAISPVLPPIKIQDKYYVDGGIFHNVPILEPLFLGADTILVFVHNTLDDPKAGAVLDFPRESNKGKAILEYYETTVSRRLMLVTELIIACSKYPNAKILGVFPKGKMCGTMDFTSDVIADMRKMGRESYEKSGMVDMCTMVPTKDTGFEKFFGGKKESNGWIVAMTFVGGLVAGVIGLITFQKTRFAVKRKATTEVEAEASFTTLPGAP